MSTLRTFNLQNPDSGTVNIEMDQGGNTLMTGIATVRGAAHFTSTSGSDAVGIGTDITAYKLDVRVTGAEAGLRVYNPDTSSNASGILRLGNDDNQNAAFLRLNGSNNTSAVGGAGSLVLGHGLSKDLHLSTAGVSRLRITSAGQLNVAGNIQFTAANPELEFNNGGARFRLPAANTLTIHTGGGLGSTSNERLRINSLGNIGMSNDMTGGGGAYARLTVQMPTQSGGSGIQVANSSNGSGDGTTSNIVLRSVNNDCSQWADAEYRASQHIFAIQGSEKVRISSGGLAINKSAAADAEIEIVQSADPTLRLHDNRNAAYKADFLMAGSAPLIRNNNTSASDRTLSIQKGTTDHLVINGNGSVNIGGDYSQTSRKLKVTTTGSSQLEVQGQEADIWMTSTGPGNTVWRILGSTGTTTHRWRVYDNTNNRDCINVYNDGSVVTPAQPRFFATLSNSYDYYDGRNVGGTWIPYNNTTYNVGGGFKTSGSDLGRFVAPVSGMYLFHARCYKGTNTNNWTQSWFDLDGSRANGTDWVVDSSRHAENAIQVYMTAGQKIGFHPYNNQNNNQITSSNNHTYFKGCLLG